MHGTRAENNAKQPVVPAVQESEKVPKMSTISVEINYYGQRFTLDVEISLTMSQIQSMLQFRYNLPVQDDWRLIWDCATLDDKITLKDIGIISSGTTIFLMGPRPESWRQFLERQKSVATNR